MSDATKKMHWPDLSAYGVTLGIIDIESGQKSLVFSDETGKYAHIAKGMGFARTRWPGLWVRTDTSITPDAFRSAFPEVQIGQMTHRQIAQSILSKIGAHVNRTAQQDLFGYSMVDAAVVQRPRPARVTVRKPGAPDAQVPSDVTEMAQAVAEVGGASAGPEDSVGASAIDAASDASDGGEDAADANLDGMLVDMSPLSIDNVPMGLNRLGEDVYQSPDGRRFSRIETEEGPRIRKETRISFPDPQEAGLFLRGDTEASLDVSAEGLVWAMAHGRIIRVDDFALFFKATTGRELSRNVVSDPEFDRVVQAVDKARVRRLSELATMPDADAFAAALRLHNAAQYYSLIKDSRMTPLPIGVVIQHMAMSMPEGSTVRVDNAARGEFSILSETHFKPAVEGLPQDILMGAYDGVPLDASVEAFGTVVSREDHARTLTALSQMSEQGLGMFLIDGDQVPGRIGPSSRRFLDTLATHFEVEGIVDVDGSLMGIPGSLPKRMIVVGDRRLSPAPPILPESLPFVTDYESLWRWGDRIAESIRKPGSVPMAERGAIAPTDDMSQFNSYQSPYIPTSTLSDPSLMVPRNLASPLRRAMIEIQRSTPHVDQWLAEQLQMTMEDLRSSLSPEQADAAVMAFKRMESGLGYMVADQTGVGKGRVLAATALLQRLRGEPVIFLTEKAELFTDFWRDLENIGADRLFTNVFVVNDDVAIISPRSGEVVAKSADRDVLAGVLRSMKLPADAQLVMATYSQFNRDPVKVTKSKGLVDLDALTKRDVSDSVRRALARESQKRKSEGKKEAQTVTVDAVDIFSDPEVLAKIPVEALKPIWIGRAAKGANLILDESHNMSGETSQTAMNLAHAAMGAESVVYSSATFARTGGNMKAYRRLFPASVDVEILHDTLKRGGEPLQEAISSMLAEDGALVRREHDLSMLTFSPQVDIKNTARNEALADSLAEILAAMGSLTREVRQYSDALSEELKDALKAANAAKGLKHSVNAIGVLKRGSIGNGLYTTMRAFLTVLKTDLVIERAVENLKAGRKPGIIIEHTMEADLNRAVEAAQKSGHARETDEGIVIPRPTFRTLLRSMLEDMTQVSLDGKELEIKSSASFASLIRLIEEKIKEFPDLPLCPLDTVRQGIESAGYSCAELSGRKRNLVDLGDGNVLVRKIPKGQRGKAKNDFNNGRTDAILLTRAGNAGISLHASPSFLNTQQRVVIEAEVPEDVIVRVQFFGRFNRKDQTSHPIIETLSSDLPAENRVLALQNNKLRKMSANVEGNRDNAAITRNIADIINVVGNQVAFKLFELRPALAIKLDVDMPDQAEKMAEDFELRGDKYVSSLFSRMVMLPVAQQREIIEEVTREFELTIDELDSLNQNPLKAKFYDVHARRKSSEALETGVELNDANGVEKKYQSSFDRPVVITEIEYTDVYKPFPKEDVLRVVAEGKEDLVASVHERLGVGAATLAKTNIDALHRFMIDGVLEMRDGLMAASKAGRFPTVADALADPENNMVKIIQWKTDRIVDVMDSMRIGGTVKFTDLNSGHPTTAVIAGMTLPHEKDLCAPGRYFVKLLVPGKNLAERLSLGYLIEDKNFAVLEKKASAKTLETFDLTEARSFTVNRNILDGNLFRAAELSIQAGVGTQAHFSDEHGMANRAVVLPTSIGKKQFSSLPIRVTDVELAARFLREVATGTLTSAPSKDGIGMTVSKNDSDIIVSMPGNAAKQAWLKNNHAVMAITGPFMGSRSKIFAAVPLSQAPELMRALYAAGTTFYAHPHHFCTRQHVDRQRLRHMGSVELDKMAGASTVRQWFIDAMNVIDDPKLVTTEAFKPRDPFDDLEAKSNPHKKLRAA